MSSTETAGEEEEKAWYEAVVDWFKEIYEWIQNNLGDPVISEMIRADLGLDPGANLDAGSISGFPSEEFDPDEAAFDETVAEITAAATAVMTLVDAIKADGMTAWDVLYLIGRLAAHDSLRLRVPALYAAAKILLFVSDDPERLGELEPDLLLTLLKGEEPPPGTGDRVFERLMGDNLLVLMIAEVLADKLGLEAFDAYTGWDPAPGDPVHPGELASTRAATLVFTAGDDTSAGDGASASLTVTILPVPAEHDGPAIVLGLGGGIQASQTIGDTTYRFQAAVGSAVDAVLPFGSSPASFEVGSSAAGLVGLDVVRGRDGVPALRIGEADGTRFDVEKLLLGVELAGDRAAFRFGVEKAKLVIDLSEGDGFLGSLPGAAIEVELGLVFTADTDGGLRVEGGTRAIATLPVNKSLFGVFTVQHVQVALGPSATRDVSLELSGAFALDLGPFRASIDRIGLLLDAEIGEGNLGIMDVAVGFKPPSGIGLALDAGPVKGGGYLYIDPVRGEYAGVLELAIGPVAVKALGIVTTKMPDGSDGWALLLLVFGEFPPIQLGFGFTLNGVGGLIGLQHAVSIDALQAGLRDGVLDDVLFPEDPVADAPRIINRLKTVFPVTPRALIFGPMFELGWGGAVQIMSIKLGVIVQLDNALGSGDEDLALGSISVLGQIKVVVPHEDAAVVRLLVDFFGYYDVAAQRLGFTARLRDSKVMEAIELSGMLVLQIQFGDNPSFVIAAGGFHPRFEDLPEGLPAKIDRIAIKKKIVVVELKIEIYFAVTPATVQVGLSATLKAKLGPVSIEGKLGFDAIFYFKPTFRFEIDLFIVVSVKFKSFNLLSVDVRMTLYGPSEWRAKGVVKFSVLFWDIEKSFDTRSGEPTEALEGATDVSALMKAEFENPSNWTAQLPAGGESVVTLGEVKGLETLLAHPLGQLGVTQRLAPLGLDMERYGQTNVAGPKRIDVASVDVGGQSLTPTKLQETFARSQFVEMTTEEKLTKRSFERLDAGVAFSTDTFEVPPVQVAADLSYETKILEPPPVLSSLWVLRPAFIASVGTKAVPIAAARMQARFGAAGIAARTRVLRDGPADAAPLKVGEVPLTLASRRTLDAAGGGVAALAPGAVGTAPTATSEALVAQAAADRGDVIVIEAIELEVGR